MAHVQLLGTGGTIASRGSGDTGSVATDAAADLACGGYGHLRVSARDILRTNSFRLTLGDLRLAGTGVGNAGPGFAESVAHAVERGYAVILSTRAPWGPVVPRYGNGGGTDLIAAGAIPSGDLNPLQARILAALLLSQGTSATELPGAFRARL